MEWGTPGMFLIDSEASPRGGVTTGGLTIGEYYQVVTTRLHPEVGLLSVSPQRQWQAEQSGFIRSADKAD